MSIRYKLLLGRLSNSAFLRNVLLVMSGSAIAQVIGFAFSPVISRLFSVAEFGIYGSFGAVTGVIAAIATLEYSQALMLPKRREDAAQVFLLSCLVTLAITMLSLVACLVAPNWLLGLLKTQNDWLLVLLVLAVFVGGLNASMQAWCVRVKAFKHTSASQVVRGLSSSSLQVGFGVLKMGAPGLVVSSVLADFLASLSLLRVIRSDFSAILTLASWQRMKHLAVEYRDFPIYSATMNGINAVSQCLPVLLLAHFYGIETAGAYAFGMRVLQTPMGLITRAIRQVLFQKASETHHKGGSLLPLYLKITGCLFGLGFLPSLVLFLWTPEIFVWLFGLQWQVAGEYARWLLLWLFFMFCNVPSVLFARIIRIQRNMFVFELLLLTGRILALLLGGVYLTAKLTILMYSVVGALMNVVVIVFVGYAIKSRENTCVGT